VDFAIGGYEVTAEAEFDALIAAFARPFNLDTAPLLRVNLIEVGSSRRLLFIDMHHIITDGTSQGILEKEFLALLAEQALPPLRLQYRDYSEWNYTVLRQEELNNRNSIGLRNFPGKSGA